MPAFGERLLEQPFLFAALLVAFDKLIVAEHGQETTVHVARVLDQQEPSWCGPVRNELLTTNFSEATDKLAERLERYHPKWYSATQHGLYHFSFGRSCIFPYRQSNNRYFLRANVTQMHRQRKEIHSVHLNLPLAEQLANSTLPLSLLIFAFLPDRAGSAWCTRSAQQVFSSNDVRHNVVGNRALRIEMWRRSAIPAIRRMVRRSELFLYVEFNGSVALRGISHEHPVGLVNFTFHVPGGPFGRFAVPPRSSSNCYIRGHHISLEGSLGGSSRLAYQASCGFQERTTVTISLQHRIDTLFNIANIAIDPPVIRVSFIPATCSWAKSDVLLDQQVAFYMHEALKVSKEKFQALFSTRWPGITAENYRAFLFHMCCDRISTSSFPVKVKLPSGSSEKGHETVTTINSTLFIGRLPCPSSLNCPT